MTERVLVDTSVWVDHLRRRNPELVALLESGFVHCHPFVIGEIACGTLGHRHRVLSLLGDLPKAPDVPDARVHEVLERSRLMGRGLGWVDMTLLVSALDGGLTLWSLDRRLMLAASALGAGRTR